MNSIDTSILNGATMVFLMTRKYGDNERWHFIDSFFNLLLFHKLLRMTESLLQANNEAPNAKHTELRTTNTPLRQLGGAVVVDRTNTNRHHHHNFSNQNFDLILDQSSKHKK